jgi:membrane associated rhomboid family serine protease
MFIPIPIPAWLFVIGYGAVELTLGVSGWQPDVAHFAHLGGMLGGFLMIEYWRGKLPIKPKR